MRRFNFKYIIMSSLIITEISVSNNEKDKRMELLNSLLMDGWKIYKIGYNDAKILDYEFTITLHRWSE